MLIDRTHARWAWGAAAIVVVAAVFYVPYARGAAAPSGGSWPGLAYGIAGFTLMLYAGLLGARKKVRIWRIGRAQTWTRGHLWLGAVSLPLIAFHAGFTFGAALTTVLMWLLLLVVASGIVGASLQHAMPRRMMRDLPMETIYEQIEHVRAQLLDEADTVVAEACGKLELQTVAPTTGASRPGAVLRAAAGAGSSALATTNRIDAEESAPLREFYMREVRPFVEHPSPRHALADEATSALRFDKLRAMVPESFHPAVVDLENICEEERQLMRQRRMHAQLHAWQLVHVPLSIALLVLSIVHIVMALRF